MARRRKKVLEGLDGHEGWALIVTGMEEHLREVHALLAMPSNQLDQVYQTNKEFLGGRYAELMAFSAMPDEMLQACEETIAEYETARARRGDEDDVDA